jgi:hypothetical protein
MIRYVGDTVYITVIHGLVLTVQHPSVYFRMHLSKRTGMTAVFSVVRRWNTVQEELGMVTTEWLGNLSRTI